MICAEVQKQMSAYLDSELSDADCQSIAAHLDGCTACSEVLAGFQSLSAVAKDFDAPSPPSDLWRGIEMSLDDEKLQIVALESPGQQRRRYVLAPWSTAAAILLIATAAIWSSRGVWNSHDHESMEANFDVFLAAYSANPEQAHETLVRAYDGQLISRDTAVKRLGYTPAALDGKLADANPEESYLLEMPCCRCSLTVCRRSDGSVLTVLEHDVPQPEWFGDRSRSECVCDGVPTDVVQVDDVLAASWRLGERFVTVIGPRNLDDVTELVSDESATNGG